MPETPQIADGLDPNALVFNRADAPESFFRAVVENAADMISVINTEGIFTYACPMAADLFGFEHGTVDRLSEERFHPDDYACVVAEFSDLVANGGRRQLTDHRITNGRGGWVWVQTHAVNLVDDPRVGGIVMVSRDVTAHKRREEQILRAEKAVGFGHWRWDADSPGPYWSDGMFSMLGLAREEHPSDMTWAMDLVAEEDRQGIIEQCMETLESGTSFTRILSLRHADGAYRRVMLTGHVERGPGGRPTSIVGVTQDITRMERADETIRQSEQEFRLLAEHSTDAITRYDLAGKVLYISPSVERLLGYSVDECVGRYSSDFLHPDDVDRVTEEILGMFTDGNIRRTSFRMMAKDGRYLWLESAMTPVEGFDKKYQGFIACTRDVTDQKIREQELMAAREKAEQASLTKSRFLANMSHELRTPLNAILGFSEMMTEQVFGPMENDQYMEYAGLIHESGSHLLSLISDILDMSKIEAGKYDLALEPVCVGTAIEKAARMVQTRVDEGELELLLQLDGADGYTVLADERAVTQILLNVLSNAVKFTPAGGRITVSALPAAHGHIAISVKDTGVGIDPDDLERVLNPFEQDVRHAELASQGTGLGLPLVRALVDMQDGAFAIESTPGRGTTVNIMLPDATIAQSMPLNGLSA